MLFFLNRILKGFRQSNHDWNAHMLKISWWNLLLLLFIQYEIKVTIYLDNSIPSASRFLSTDKTSINNIQYIGYGTYKQVTDKLRHINVSLCLWCDKLLQIVCFYLLVFENEVLRCHNFISSQITQSIIDWKVWYICKTYKSFIFI